MTKLPQPGKLFIVSGPSQVGKDTIVRSLHRDKSLKLAHIITNTTRAKRPGERDGITYNFMSESEFNTLVAKGELLEWARVRQAFFGTPKEPVTQALQQGRNVILQIDVQGAAQVKTKLPATVLIFIAAESPAEVKRRIMASTKMTPEQKTDRWREARAELKEQPRYQYTIVNRFGQLRRTLSEAKAIIRRELGEPMDKA